MRRTAGLVDGNHLIVGQQFQAIAIQIGQIITGVKLRTGDRPQR